MGGKVRRKSERKNIKDKKAVQDPSLLTLRACANPKPPPYVRKRRCSDCLYCQRCSLERCRLCRASKTKASPQTSRAEPGDLHDRIKKKKETGKKKDLIKY